MSQQAHDAMRAYNLALFENPVPTVAPAAWYYPISAPRVMWLTFADDTGCGLWDDDPASVGAEGAESRIKWHISQT